MKVKVGYILDCYSIFKLFFSKLFCVILLFDLTQFNIPVAPLTKEIKRKCYSGLCLVEKNDLIVFIFKYKSYFTQTSEINVS